ncbi:MAG: hypothetical protein MI862_21220 [Desulfobacterales bacterium]|nr:hypothetical protein [Desulfobacterales bacterium]
MATPVIVNKQTASGTAVSSLQVTMTGVTAGNILVGCVLQRNSAIRTFTFSDNKSNTWVSAGRAGTSRHTEIEYALNVADGDITVTCMINVSTASFSIAVFELSGVDSLGSTDTYIDETDSTSHPCADPAVDTNAECVIITATQCNSTAGVITPANGYTNEYSPHNNLVQSRVSESALTDQTVTWTSSKARYTYSVFAEFYNSQAGGSLSPVNGSLSSATGMTAGFNGRSGSGGGLDAVSVNSSLDQVGRSGLSGDLASEVSVAAQLLGNLDIHEVPNVGDGSFSAVTARFNTALFAGTGVSGDLTTNSSSPRLELLQISRSEPISRIDMAVQNGSVAFPADVQSGSVVFPGPAFGTIEILTNINKGVTDDTWN